LLNGFDGVIPVRSIVVVTHRDTFGINPPTLESRRLQPGNRTQASRAIRDSSRFTLCIPCRLIIVRRVIERTIGQQQKPGWGVSYVAKVRITNVQSQRSIANILPGWKLKDVMEGDVVLAY